jgi:hypothetical protein
MCQSALFSIASRRPEDSVLVRRHETPPHREDEKEKSCVCQEIQGLDP